MDIKNQITDTTPSPQIPPRRTRLGQSSLNQASVLPVVSPTKAFVNHTAPPEPSGVKLNIPTTQTAGITVPIPCHTTKSPSTTSVAAGLMSPPAIFPHSSRPLPDPHAMTPPPVPPHRPRLPTPIPEKQEFQRTNSKRAGMIAKSAVSGAEDYSDVGFTAPAWQATESATRGSKQTTQSPAKFSVVKTEVNLAKCLFYVFKHIEILLKDKVVLLSLFMSDIYPLTNYLLFDFVYFSLFLLFLKC